MAVSSTDGRWIARATDGQPSWTTHTDVRDVLRSRGSFETANGSGHGHSADGSGGPGDTVTVPRGFRGGVIASVVQPGASPVGTPISPAVRVSPPTVHSRATDDEIRGHPGPSSGCPRRIPKSASGPVDRRRRRLDVMNDHARSDGASGGVLRAAREGGTSLTEPKVVTEQSRSSSIPAAKRYPVLYPVEG